MSKQIQWYPGHMSKTLREFKENSKNIDIFFLLIDSRAPKSSLIDSFHLFAKSSKIIIVITKSDLVEKNELSKWINYYKKKYRDCIFISFLNKNIARKKIIEYLNKQKFNNLLPKFSIIGIPNVGKSTFLNILLNKTSSKVENRAGVTKKASWYQLENKYWIMDNPGILEPKFKDFNQGIILASIGAIKLDILPLRDVVYGLFDILKNEKNNENSNFLLDYSKLKNEEFNSNKIGLNDHYKSLLINFQKLKYGKIILD